MSQVITAARKGCDGDALADLYRLLGPKTRRPRGHPRLAFGRAEIIQAAKEGMRLRSIARRHGVHISTILNRFKETPTLAAEYEKLFLPARAVLMDQLCALASAGETISPTAYAFTTWERQRLGLTSRTRRAAS
jgi:hypothetical protein